MAKKTISPELKLKIVLEALKEERHIGYIASEYGIHSTTIKRKRKNEYTYQLLKCDEIIRSPS